MRIKCKLTKNEITYNKIIISNSLSIELRRLHKVTNENQRESIKCEYDNAILACILRHKY